MSIMSWEFLEHFLLHKTVSVSGFTLYVSLLTYLLWCFCNDHKHWLFATDFLRDVIAQIKDDYL